MQAAPLAETRQDRMIWGCSVGAAPAGIRADRQTAAGIRTPGVKMEKVSGYVEHIIYRNTENGYTVFELIADGEEITCVGSFQTIDEGEGLELSGGYVEHAVYGSQFKVESYEEVLPEDEQSMERYLGSGAVRGVGPSLAARIVRKFGKDTFRIVEQEPERLAEVKGISDRRTDGGKKGSARSHDLPAEVRDLQRAGHAHLPDL